MVRRDEGVRPEEIELVEGAPLSVPRLETPPPPPLPTRRDVNAGADPDLSDVFAAIIPKKAATPPPPPPPPPGLFRTKPPRPPEIFIPPPPPVPTIEGPAIPAPIAIPPTMMLPQGRPVMRPAYVSSLNAVSIPPRSQQATPFAAIAAVAALLFLVVGGAGFGYGFVRAGDKRVESPMRDARSFETSRIAALGTESAGAKEDQPDAPKPVQLGTIRFSSSPPGALVDGAPRKVMGGAIVVTCGTHRIKWPGHATQAVTVPCNGVTTL